MNVQIKLARPGYHETRKGWRKGLVIADVDGHSVALLEHKGWSCRCTLPDCLHIDAVSRAIHPETIARIQAGRPTP